MVEMSVACWTIVAGLVGASVTSFLNVVAYGVSRGPSLSHPPSACPRCGPRIRARQHVPVPGSLLLACGLSAEDRRETRRG
jgi:leader peptidase (prepilin peptidase)/N-methyltransferase